MSLRDFERVVRSAAKIHEGRDPREPSELHPFDERNILPDFPSKVRKLFDNGHYEQATFEACKFLEKQVRKVSGENRTGFNLMMSALGGDPPKVILTDLSDQSGEDEQKGYQFLFAGTSLGIRNPRGHEVEMNDDPDVCLEHLGIVSHLLRRLRRFNKSPHTQ